MWGPVFQLMCLASDLNELIVGIVSVLSLDCIQSDGSVQLPASQEISTTQVQLGLTGHLQSHVSWRVAMSQNSMSKSWSQDLT